MLSAGTIFTQLALMLVVGLLIYSVSKKYRLPELLILLAVGFGFSQTQNNGVFPVHFPPLVVQVVGIIAIALVTFEGAKELNLKRLTGESVKSIQMMLLMTVVGTVGLGWLLNWLAGLSWPVALILSSAATGESQLLLIMAQGKKGKVFDYLRLESLLNPGLDIIIPLLIMDLMFTSKRMAFSQALVLDQVMNLVMLFAVGIGAGVIIALIIYHIFSKAYYRITSHLGLITAIFAAYALAEAINGSGIIASLTLGLAFANIGFVHREELFQSVSVFSRLMSILLPIMLGTLVSLPLNPEFWILSLSTFLALLVFRFISVTAIFYKDFPIPERIFMTLAFPKGMVLTVISAILATLTVPGAAFAFDLAIAYLVYSIALCSLIMPFSSYFVSQSPSRKYRKH